MVGNQFNIVFINDAEGTIQRWSDAHSRAGQPIDTEADNPSAEVYSMEDAATRPLTIYGSIKTHSANNVKFLPVKKIRKIKKGMQSEFNSTEKI